jgi:hypothetical protein
MSDVKYVSAYADRERAGYATKLSEMVLLGEDISFRQMSARDRFLVSADAIERSLREQFPELGLGEDDNTVILGSTENIDIDYKNPCGWVLGYIVSRDQSNEETYNVDVDKLKYVIDNVLSYANMYGNLEDWGVTPPDIVRYTRYWIELER